MICQECGKGPCKYSQKTDRKDKVTRETCLVCEKPEKPLELVGAGYRPDIGFYVEYK